MAALAERAEGNLPATYVTFMEIAGNGVDDFLRGSDFTVEDLDGAREAADELLVEAGLDPLPSSAFVFVMHQGYQFYYFQDGAVYDFKEGDIHSEKRFDSFESLFDSVVQNILQRHTNERRL
jgi:hypothetical protein